MEEVTLPVSSADGPHRSRVAVLARIDEKRRHLHAVIAATEAAKEQTLAASARVVAARERTQAAIERTRAASGRSELIGVERELAADERDYVADERDRIADERDRIADQRDALADRQEAAQHAEREQYRENSTATGRIVAGIDESDEQRRAKALHWRDVSTRARLRTADMAEVVAEAADQFASLLEQSSTRGDVKRRREVASAEREIARIGRRNAARLREGRTEYGMMELEHLPRLPL